MIAPRNPKDHLIVLAAGGTGGHVFPAEALAQALLAQGHRLALITDQRGTSYSGTLGLVETYSVSGQGIAGRGLLGLVRGVIALAYGTLQARRILQTLKPSAVVGFGGYASAPTMAAAAHLGISTVIHEQNAVLGRANRLLAKHVDRVCTSLDLLKTPKDVTTVRTGMPVRPAIAAMRGTPYEAPTTDGTFRVLVLGGSQGAKIFSDVLPEAVRLLPETLRQRLEITQQCRPEELDRTHASYVGTGAHVQLRVFFDNVPELLAKTHLLISRSGSSTVAEAAVSGRPSLLVPYPYATDDHQSANARALSTRGAAWMLRQNEFTPASLAKLLGQFAAAPYGLSAAAAAASAFAVPDAAQRLAGVVTDLIRGENSARLSAATTQSQARNTNIHQEPMKRGVI